MSFIIRALPRFRPSNVRHQSTLVATAATETALGRHQLPPATPLNRQIAPPKYNLHVQATRNNTSIIFASHRGALAWANGGSVGFKKVQRSGYEAGYQAALKIFEDIAKYLPEHPSIHLSFSGFGQGREAVIRALSAVEGEGVRLRIDRITDRTPIKIGGTRAKKKRIL